MDTVHTYPVNDLIEHDTSGGDCICGPTRMPTPPTRRNLTRHASQPNREGMPPEGQTTSPDAA